MLEQSLPRYQPLITSGAYIHTYLANMPQAHKTSELKPVGNQSWESVRSSQSNFAHLDIHKTLKE